MQRGGVSNNEFVEQRILFQLIFAIEQGNGSQSFRVGQG